MMSVTISLIGAAAILVTVLIWVTVHKGKKKPNPPGPAGKPFVGQGLSVQLNSAHIQFTKWCKDYGHIFSFSIFGRNIVILNQPDTIRNIFGNNETANDRPPSFIGHYIANSCKDILFRNYDDVCRKLKCATMKTLHAVECGSSVLKDYQLAEINDFVKHIASKDEHDINIVESLTPTLCKILGLWLTGQRLANESPVLQAILDFDRDGNEMISPATHLVYKVLPFMRFIPGYYGDLYKRTIRSKEAVKEQLLINMKDDYAKNTRNCLLHQLFEMQTTEKWLTDDLILGVILDLINTSTLTSKGVLSGLMFLLVHFQDVQEKIRKEIDNVIGKDCSPLIDDLQNMPYTHAFIIETLRYQSHLALTATHTNLEDIETEQYNIPKGSSIFGNIWNVHHDECFWRDPYNFRPERFLKEDGSLLPLEHETRHKYYMPFGVGSRSCLGVTATYSRMFLFCTVLLQKHVLLPPRTVPLPSHDPRELIGGAVLQMPNFVCRVSAR